jgi:2-polyprenyl-3-methyl-5-hydroxy-6-metoxy-1,4-benzoquinol methylase
MKALAKKIIQIFKGSLGFQSHLGQIGNNGERVDINLRKSPYFWQLDVYQKNHIKRYEFAANLISSNDSCGDMACGSGYGSYILSKKAKEVLGADIDRSVVEVVRERYKDVNNLKFIYADLRDIDFESKFDKIISFETVEHVEADMVPVILNNFSKALIPGGVLIFSVPFMQKRTPEAIAAGHHKTFEINEKKIEEWMNQVGLQVFEYYYQNYEDHKIRKDIEPGDDFVICLARK